MSGARAAPVEAAAVASQPLLRVCDLRTHFHSEAGVGRAVDGVSFQVPAGAALGLVGESGCGKSVTALSILRLVPDPPGRIVGGQVWLGDRDLLRLSDREICRVRGRDAAMVFQEPMTSLNPVLTCGYQIAEAIELHQGVSRAEARHQAVEALRRVRMPAPEQRLDEYPHQLSGGMRQRVMIAMALSCRPGLLIADEPTTALDVTIQAQILDLLASLQAELGMAMVLITHDLGVIAEAADAVAVMYAGRIVEEALTGELFDDPRHPYTQGLLRSVLRLGDAPRDRLDTIPGSVPDATAFPSGCRFHPRCPLADAACRQAVPELEELSPGHRVACWKAHG
ncbi:MAG: ABC transporter ATP-binding protein [Gemmatimonadota bacterium]